MRHVGEQDLEAAVHNLRDVYEENPDAAAEIVEELDNINLQDDRGLPLLHFAADNNFDEVARFLFEKGAGGDVKTIGGSTPLHRVAWKNSEAVARLLIEKGAKIDVRSRQRASALQ